jgi:hypothetical protein
MRMGVRNVVCEAGLEDEGILNGLAAGGVSSL